MIGRGWGPTVLKGRRRSREGGWGDGRSHEGEKEGEGRSRDGGEGEGRSCKREKEGLVRGRGRGKGKVRNKMKRGR